MVGKLLAFAILGFAGLSTAAHARDNATYAGMSAGGMNLRPIKYISAPDFGVVRSKTGFDLAAVVGHDFGVIRAEGEVGYKRASAESVDVGAGPIPLNGRSSEFSAMANVLLDVSVSPGFDISAGGGAGAAWARPNYSAAGLTTAGHGTKFAWQLIAEARLAVSKSVDVGLRYRYHNVNNMRSSGSGIDARGDWRSHSILASLFINFP
jgi:opacity protein-like surface antigen